MSRTNLKVEVAALGLSEVGDVAYALAVRKSGGAVVWSASPLRASQYGDGRSLTYIGPCDATPGDAEHVVSVEVLDLFDEGGGRIDPSTYQNPGVVEVRATCVENADTLVPVSLTLMRDASQGFFDVAVTFDDVFCSAKLDCKVDGLVFDPRTSERIPTAVVGLACAGPGATHLWLDQLALTCGGTTTPLDIEGPAGNQYTAAAMPPAPVAQVATYRGTQRVTSAGVDLESVYFDVGLGIDLAAVTTDCRVSFAATASKALFTPPFTTPAGAVWPVIHWDMDLVDGETKAFACKSHPLDDPDAAPGAGVFTAYTAPGAPHVFDYHVMRDLAAPAGSGATVMERRDGGGGSTLGEVVVRVYADAGDDGVFEDGTDLPLAGVEVRFDGAGGPVTRVTGADGRASAALDAGAWSASVASGGVNAEPLTGFVASRPTLPAALTVIAGGSTSLALGFVEAAEVRGVVFVGAADDRLFDGDEEVLAGVSVELARAGTPPTTTTATTDARGRYRFVVRPGSFTLSVPAGQPALAGNASLDGPRPLTLTPGEFVAIDLGVAP